MLQEVEVKTPTTRRLKINIPVSVIEGEIAKAYNKLKTIAKIPGFRPGKVPQSILERKFGKEIENEVLGKIVPEFYSKAVEEAKITPVTYPDIDGDLKIVKNQPLSFTVTVEIKPEIENLNYEGIELKEKPFSVEEDEVKTALNVLQENKAILKVSDFPLRKGDVAIIDCGAFTGGEEVKELSSKDYPFILGSQALPQEFTGSLSGKKKGDNLEIKINFEAEHLNRTIAGKEILFKVLITEIKEKILPPLDDEFAKGFKCSDMEELKKKIHENIYNRKKNQITTEYKNEIIDYLVSNHNLEVPASMVNRELEHMILEAKQSLTRENIPYKKAEELKKDYEQKARKNVAGLIILEAIGKKEKIEITEDDIKKAIDELSAQNELKPEEVKKLYIMRDGSLDGLKNRLFTDKILETVLSKAAIK